MRVEGSHLFAAQREEVFPLIRDPEVLATVLPGCERLEPAGDDRFKGVLNVKIGPIQGSFDGEVAFTDMVEPESGRIVVNGQGAPGFVSGTGRFWIENGEGDSTLRYEGDAQIGGKLASVGQRLLDTSARAIIKSGLDGLDAHVSARTGGPPGEQRAVQPESPSQPEIAREVARSIAQEALGDEDRRAFLKRSVGAAVLLLLLYRLYRLMSRSAPGAR